MRALQGPAALQGDGGPLHHLRPRLERDALRPAVLQGLLWRGLPGGVSRLSRRTPLRPHPRQVLSLQPRLDRGPVRTRAREGGGGSREMVTTCNLSTNTTPKDSISTAPGGLFTTSLICCLNLTMCSCFDPNLNLLCKSCRKWTIRTYLL